ncbi:hypothetical protein K474DRAFT_1708795 [Panus rudis PR-1116 ss-1]|nr:hypothetical protein K474DRAFT_1708795 [Panus rudis PR-1116 ss-1]
MSLGSPIAISKTCRKARKTFPQPQTACDVFSDDFSTPRNDYVSAPPSLPTIPISKTCRKAHKTFPKPQTACDVFSADYDVRTPHVESVASKSSRDSYVRKAPTNPQSTNSLSVIDCPIRGRILNVNLPFQKAKLSKTDVEIIHLLRSKKYRNRQPRKLAWVDCGKQGRILDVRGVSFSPFPGDGLPTFPLEGLF